MRVLRFAFSAALAVGAALAQNPAAQYAQQSPKQVAPSPDANTVLVYVGTYTRDEGWVNGTGKGVHVLSFNTKSGELTQLDATPVGVNPTFVTGNNNSKRPMFYAIAGDAVNTNSDYVYALSADASGKLTIVNRAETRGTGTAHVSLSPNNDFVTVSSYNSGSVALFPVNINGSLQEASDFHEYKGGSNVKPNQDVSHMHSMTWAGVGSTGVFGADLGNDRIAQFNLDKEAKKLVVNKKNEFIQRPPGAGPRHMTIHPTHKYAYVVDELGSTIGVYDLDMSSGSLAKTATQLISTLPTGFNASNSAADIHTSEFGQFLYVSNRGHNSIATYRIGAKGKLTLLGHESSRGKTPRNFAVYKNFLIVANQDSNNMEVFKLDTKTGLPTYTNQTLAIGTPVCVFIPRY